MTTPARPAAVTHVEQAGWDVVRLTSETVEADIVPGKGGDILALRWRATGLNVLWSSPWGLRHRGEPALHAGPTEAFLDQYPGGWQCIFPNGGDGVTEAGANLGFHGEASLCSWQPEVVDGPDGPLLEMRTRLRRSPFEMRRTVSLKGSRLDVVESARNVGGEPVEAMWSHHPAFGAPFLSGACRLETAARTFHSDDARDAEAGDLRAGAQSDWPHVAAKVEGTVDLRVLPEDGPAVDRFGYLTDFERGWAALTNPDLGLKAELEWDLDVFPHAWLWVEARATAGYPWYRAAYVVAVEPASSWPGQGLHEVRTKTGTHLRFEPGQERTVSISCTLSAVDPVETR